MKDEIIVLFAVVVMMQLQLALLGVVVMIVPLVLY